MMIFCLLYAGDTLLLTLLYFVGRCYDGGCQMRRLQEVLRTCACLICTRTCTSHLIAMWAAFEKTSATKQTSKPS